jgi:hypothetical protein
MLHQESDQAEGQDRGALADQEPEMRAMGAGHTQGEQAPQGGMGNDVRRIVEEARIEARLPDDGIGIKAGSAQGRRDLLSNPEMDVAGGQRLPMSRRCGVLTYADPLPNVARRRKRGTIKFLHKRLMQVDRSSITIDAISHLALR